MKLYPHLRSFLPAFGTILLLLGCSDLKQTALLRLKSDPGKVNTYLTIFEGDFSRYRVDSLIVKRHVRYEIYTFEDFPPSVNDSIIRFQSRDSGRYRVDNLIDSTSADSSWVEEGILFSMSPQGRLIDLESLAENGGMDLSYNRAIAEQTYPVFPMEPVAVGREWTQSTKVIQNGSPLQASITFNVKSFEKLDGFEVVAIGYDGLAIIPLPAKPSDSTFISAFNRLKVTGTIWYDYNRGGMYKQTEHRLLTGERLSTEKPGDSVKYRYDGVYDMETRLISSKNVSITKK